MRVVVVTDSTASLPEDLAARRGIMVVPLQVVLGSAVHDEGAGGATPELVARSLRTFVPVSTSRPSPAVMREVYARAVDAGATAIVSVHISADMSGTFESAQLAARDAGVPVLTVDTRQVGVGTGYAALSAADVVDAGGTAQEAAAAARLRARGATSLFYVDTLEHLRRGGRIGAAAAFLGGALAVKPLLRIEDGRVGSLERVRTSARALGRLEELAVEAATGPAGPSAVQLPVEPAAPHGHLEAAQDRRVPGAPYGVDVCVAHLASPERAAQLTEHLTRRLADELAGAPVWCAEVGAVLGAHVGPGMLAVCVAPRLQPPGWGRSCRPLGP